MLWKGPCLKTAVGGRNTLQAIQAALMRKLARGGRLL